MTFLNVLGVPKILCSFRLVLEGKTGKKIPESSRLEFLEKFFFSKQFCWRQHPQAIEQRSCSRFTFVENTISNSPKIPKAQFLGSHGFFCFISICKFDSFKNPSATITSLSELSFRFKRFILLIQAKKLFL